MRRRVRQFLSDQSGASAVEFALVALPLILLTVGIVEVGRAIFTQQSLSYAIDHAVRGLYLGQPLDGISLKEAILAESFLVDQTRLGLPQLELLALSGGPDDAEIWHLQVVYQFESIVADWVFDMIPMTFDRIVVLSPQAR